MRRHKWYLTIFLAIFLSSILKVLVFRPVIKINQVTNDTFYICVCGQMIVMKRILVIIIFIYFSLFIQAIELTS